ncbi:hypothetical protein DVS77_11870 [Mycolicibacterium moriokaense]|nr:hypothetical protein DVS77_11870 [Mycolicibacterium moriokaense]
MDERLVPVDRPASEAVATTGLFLNIASVIALAVSFASWSASAGVIASIAGVFAMLTFGASLVCFSRQAEDNEIKQVA